MIQLKGKYADAKVFVNTVEQEALDQIQEVLDSQLAQGTKVRIMPDCHAGKGCTIGTTIKLPENFEDWKVCPNIVGVDVGCGILMYKLAEKDVDLVKLDEVINKAIPSGTNIRWYVRDEDFVEDILRKLSFKAQKQNRVKLSLGTLGGGNHFIELGKDQDGALWLSVHSGSRNLGVQVAKYHQDVAEKNLNHFSIDKKAIIEQLKAEGREAVIEITLQNIKKQSVLEEEQKDLAGLTQDSLKEYLNDMALAQDYAVKSRHAMLDIIVKLMGLTVIDSFDSIHNFVEHDNYTNGMIRKGATSAKKGERLVIPLNMRDGSLICEGLGNEEWNCSAPHGAGRLMSRSKAKSALSLDDFRYEMKDIYSTSVLESTLDEAPGAYKSADEIIELIKDTVKVKYLVKPIYNFKAH